jgi:epoxyqueuosine reductase
LLSYKKTKKELTSELSCQLHIASFALGFEGLDYHDVLKVRLHLIGETLAQNNPHLKYQISLDVHPVLERDLAHRSGLGWIGKNSMLINRVEGSYFIIASLLLNQKYAIPFRNIETDHCGKCTLCIDACPTGAINKGVRTIRASDCISTFTIEQMKLDSMPSEKMDLNSGNIFGCDICQDVCPWNKKLLNTLSLEAGGKKNTEMQNTLLDFFCSRSAEEIAIELQEMSNGHFRKKFRRTSFKRSGKQGILKNLYFYIKNRAKISFLT